MPAACSRQSSGSRSASRSSTACCRLEVPAGRLRRGVRPARRARRRRAVALGVRSTLPTLAEQLAGVRGSCCRWSRRGGRQGGGRTCCRSPAVPGGAGLGAWSARACRGSARARSSSPVRSPSPSRSRPASAGRRGGRSAVAALALTVTDYPGAFPEPVRVLPLARFRGGLRGLRPGRQTIEPMPFVVPVSASSASVRRCFVQVRTLSGGRPMRKVIVGVSLFLLLAGLGGLGVRPAGDVGDHRPRSR